MRSAALHWDHHYGTRRSVRPSDPVIAGLDPAIVPVAKQQDPRVEPRVEPAGDRRDMV
jgi:hypothetical protein